MEEGTNMLEALILSLSLSDQSYYGREDLRDHFISLLKKMPDQHVAVILGTPGIWDMNKYPEMPLYIAYKWTEGPDITPVSPPDDGFIVCSSVLNDGIRILPLIDNSHKMPLADVPPVTPPPPGTDMNTVTTGYDGLWNRFSARDMGWAGEELAMAVVCGPVISNVRTIKLVNRHPVKTAQVPDQTIKGPDYYHVKSKRSPQIPASPGIAFAETGNMKIVPGEPGMLHGSYCVPDTRGKDIIIHLLFSRPSHPGLSCFTVSIPYASSKCTDSMCRGYFLFDVMNTMYWKRGERFDVPETMFVSGVYKNIFSNPVLLKLVK
jgi:hypothetical protein